MADENTLSPEIASFIATNCYYTLKDWAENYSPKAGTENESIIEKHVLGSSSQRHKMHEQNTSLQNTQLSSANLGAIFTAKTGINTKSGFGYTLSFKRDGLRHCVVATRGTRPEMKGKPDLLTDLRGTYTTFKDFGLVHNGFKKTYDSILPSLSMGNAKKDIDAAEIIHFVGHSLGGAVATLLAANYSESKSVKLYTFGSPRVGALTAHINIEKKIGINNIYRVAHDMDVISLIPAFPYIHLVPYPKNNNITLESPSKLIDLRNHEMTGYINDVRNKSWGDLRLDANYSRNADDIMAKHVLGLDSDGWVARGCIKTLSMLFKLLRYLVGTISSTLSIALTPIDLLAEILFRGLQMMAEIAKQIHRFLKWLARWIGITVTEAADFTTTVIRAIVGRMLTTCQVIAQESLDKLSSNLTPINIAIATGIVLDSVSVF